MRLRYQTPQTNHSQYSSPVEVLSLIVDSKSQPVDLDNLTIGLHLLLRRKKSLHHIVLWICVIKVAYYSFSRLN